MRTLLLTSYLTTRPHPITHKPVPPDSDQLIETWHAGVVRAGMLAVVFHDQLSRAFVDRYQNDNVRFLERPPAPPHLSNNDWRFVLYRHWLVDQRARGSDLHVDFSAFPTMFAVDMFDTIVKRDPMSLVLSRPDILVWTGTDRRTPTIAPGTKDGDWIIHKIRTSYGEKSTAFERLQNQPYVTAALLGGTTAVASRLFDDVAQEVLSVSKTRPDVNSNMAAVNWVVNRGYIRSVDIWRDGEPLHSQPCRHETDADVCFVHK